MKNKEFLESIFLASPTLHASVLAFNLGKEILQKQQDKIILACAKYMLRSRSRSTPFGLFSGIGMLKWSEKKTSVIIENEINRKTRLFMPVLFDLLRALQAHPGLKEHLKYYVNNSHYILSDEVRYLEYQIVNGKKIFQLSSLELNDYLLQAIKAAEKGITLNRLTKLFVSEDIKEEEASGFVQSLIESQLLICELEPSLTGHSYLKKVITIIEEKNHDFSLNNLVEQLGIIEDKLKKLDASGINEEEDYKEIKDLIYETGLRPNDEAKFFHVDAQLNVKSGSVVNSKYQDEIIQALAHIQAIGSHEEPADLAAFKRKFRERYGSKEVSLLEVLDIERGLGYGSSQEEAYAPMLEGIVLPIKTPKKEISSLSKPQEIKLSNALSEAKREKKYLIEFDTFGFGKPKGYLNIGVSHSVVFRLLGKGKIYLEGLSGSSAINSLSRFAGNDDFLRSFLGNLAEEEQANNPEVIFAEIIHLPNEKIANVLYRPVFRTHEIPCLTHASVAKEFQICLQDLMVSVCQNQVVLRDKLKNKIIIPRLGTAHNYVFDSLPIYQFLCDVQFQHIPSGMKFDWGEAKNGHIFLPRVTKGNLVLSLATWQFKETDISNIISKRAFQTWKDKWRIPNLFVVLEGDNELLIDAENSFLIDLFIEICRNKKELLIKEFLLDQDCPVKSENGLIKSNQIIASLVREGSLFNNRTLVNESEVEEDNYIINGEWAYFKLYCGARAADKVLLDGIKPIVEEAIGKGWISQWFFVRYYDPNFHLRLRFKLCAGEHSADFLNLLRTHLKELQKSGIVWKCITDKYEPEIERYGAIGTPNAEELFCFDSQSYLQFLQIESEEDKEENKFFFALATIDKYLDFAGMNLQQKKDFIEKLRDYFSQEFGMDQSFKRQLDFKFRQMREAISSCLDSNSSEKKRLLEFWHGSATSQLLKKISTNSTIQFRELGAFLHLHVNRSMTTKPRLHELIIYDFLYRHYHSLMARNKKH